VNARRDWRDAVCPCGSPASPDPDCAGCCRVCCGCYWTHQERLAEARRLLAEEGGAR